MYINILISNIDKIKGMYTINASNMSEFLNQNEVAQMLSVAASPNCKAEKRNEIRERLVGAAIIRDMRTFVRQLFDQTVEHNPSELPSQFPGFALACATPQGKEACEPPHVLIDWELTDVPEKGQESPK